MSRGVWLGVAALLVIPFVALLSVPLYTSVQPRLGGFPFFYWYQLAWVPLSAGCTGLAYLLVRRHERGRHEDATSSGRPDGADG